MSSESSSVKVKVLFFAKAKDLSGCSETVLEIKQSLVSVGALKDLLCETFNLDIIKQNLILAVNEQYSENLAEVLQLRDNDEIAIIPPISGG